MRIKWFDRLLIIVSSIALLALGAFIIFTAFGIPPIGDVGARVINTLRIRGLTNGTSSWTWLIIGVMTLIGVALIAWGVRQVISILPKKTKQSFFNAREMENGTLSISLTALEHLVNRCLSEHTEFANSHIRISGDDDKARVLIKSTITGGASMPKSTAVLQKEIVDHLADYAGITVRSVDVVVEDTRLPGQLPQFDQKQLPDAESRFSKSPQILNSPYSILTGGEHIERAAQTSPPKSRADSIFDLDADEEYDLPEIVGSVGTNKKEDDERSANAAEPAGAAVETTEATLEDALSAFESDQNDAGDDDYDEVSDAEHEDEGDTIAADSIRG